MTDDEFIHEVVAACRRLPDVEAVVIGGSRARGDHRHPLPQPRRRRALDGRGAAGRFEVHILGFHLAGIPTYMLAGEVATCRTLWGELAPVEFPTALRASAPARCLARAADELADARHWVSTENPVSCSEALARAVLQCAHARPRRDRRGDGALTTGRNVLAAVNVRGRPGPGRPRDRRPRCRRRA